MNILDWADTGPAGLPDNFEIALVRHAQSVSNVAGRFSGTSDVPLTRTGREMARLIAGNAALRAIEGVFCSPSSRALETARAIAKSCGLAEPDTVEGLRELDFGVWEGQSIREIETGKDYQRWAANPFLIAPPGGETGLALLARAFAALCEALRQRRRIAIVTHKTPARLLSAVLQGTNPLHYRRLSGYHVASVTYLCVRDGRLACCVPANVDHLPPAWRADPDAMAEAETPIEENRHG